MRSFFTPFLLLLSLLTTTITADPDARYVITIDGGSSGSRVHIHQVTTTGSIPQIVSAVNQKIKPGLSSFENNPQDAQEHVKGLIDFALDNIPQEKWATTPLFLKATAGLRSIPKEASDEILAVVRGNFAATPFLFEHPEWARVISGTEEGTFSWIAVNYLKGRFGQTAKPLVGVIEMGGASLQISYPVEQTKGENIVNIELDHSYNLYAHSFLGYGLEKAQELLVEKEPDSVPVCYLEGYNTDAIIGKGDYEACANSMDSLMGKAMCPASTNESCAMNGKLLPNYDKVDFLAIENFFYTAEFMQIEDNFPALPEKGRDFCKQTWENAQESFPKEDINDLYKYCFSSAFLTAVLEKGFDMPLDRVEVARRIGDYDIDWPVGSVIHDVMQYFHKQEARAGKGEEENLETTKTDVLQFLFLLLGTILVAMYVLRRRQKSMRETH